MVFNSLQFLVFFGIVTSAYFLLAHKYRWALLLLASCYFYMAFVPIYLGILGLTIVIDYFAGIYLERFQGGAKKIFLGCSLMANLGVLAIFKYYFFFTDNFNFLANYFSVPVHFPVFNFLLPIGLSFHTFQAMSYTIEVYRGNQKAERNFGIYSLYVMFYPQLVAGPIERPQNLIHQFYENHVWDTDRVKSGLLQMMQGFFKKVVIADRLAMVVDPAYANLSNQSSLNLIIASIFYSFQIYCDFSGYSDIAIGASKVMGFKLMNNFNAPYTATSIPDFWRRWHISLSTWFKDYVYFSLGGNRVSVPRWYINIMIVFILSGFWHGASWNFVIWGALHGLFQLIGLTLNRVFPNLAADQRHSVAGIWMYRLITFLLVTIAWVFFRIPKFGDIQIYFRQITQGTFSEPISLAFNTHELLFSMGLIIGLYLFDLKRDKIKVDSVQLFWPMMAVMAFLIYFFGVFNMKQFIYFQF
jgi:D-alanyl-lipoteichoic acid acyltransferase DltB (MBOAT superfamily)